MRSDAEGEAVLSRRNAIPVLHDPLRVDCTIFDMLILVQVHHRFERSFSYFCQALIL